MGPEEEEPLDADFRLELLALAYAVLANAQRVADKPWEAEATFERAFVFLEEWADSPLPLSLFHADAQVHALHASLLMDTRRFPQALAAGGVRLRGSTSGAARPPGGGE